MKLPLFKAHLPETEIIQNIREVIHSGFINEGIQVTSLTNKLATKFQTNNVVLLNSCTSALTLALHLSGVENGDEVISTPMTCVATNTPIHALGAKIVWADINPKSGMLDPQDVEKKITSKTKAVMAVAWAGTPPDLNSLKSVCEKHNIKLILDAAHAFAAQYRGKQIHVWADFTCYSFQAIKHFTTGDGGALISLSNSDHKRAKSLKWFGLDRDTAKDAAGNWKGQQWDIDIVDPGFKYNMNNISAAIGLAQLNHIDRIISVHRRNAATYDRLFENSNTIIPAYKPEGSLSSHWVYTVRLQNTNISRDDLLKALNEQEILAGVVHIPNDNYTAFKKYKKKLPGVREFSECQFSLPCGWWITTDHVHHIANKVKELAK